MKTYSTYNLNAIVEACNTARIDNKLVLIKGMRQGATRSLIHYCKRNLDAHYFSFENTARLQSDFACMLDKLDETGFRHKVDENESEIKVKLIKLVGNGLLVFDHLPWTIDTLCFLNNVWDARRNYMGLVVCFKAERLDAITVSHGFDTERGKFLRRATIKVNLSPPTKDEVRDIAKEEGVSDWQSLHLSVRNFAELFGEIDKLKAQ